MLNPSHISHSSPITSQSPIPRNCDQGQNREFQHQDPQNSQYSRKVNHRITCICVIWRYQAMYTDSCYRPQECLYAIPDCCTAIPCEDQNTLPRCYAMVCDDMWCLYWQDRKIPVGIFPIKAAYDQSHRHSCLAAAGYRHLSVLRQSARKLLGYKIVGCVQIRFVHHIEITNSRIVSVFVQINHESPWIQGERTT